MAGDMMTWTREQVLHWLRYGVPPTTTGKRTEPGTPPAKATPPYTVVFQNAITRRPGSSEQHDCDTFEAAVTLANDVTKWPFNNTRVSIIDNDDGHIDYICPDLIHRIGRDSMGRRLCVCGFRPDSTVEADDHIRANVGADSQGVQRES